MSRDSRGGGSHLPLKIDLTRDTTAQVHVRAGMHPFLDLAGKYLRVGKAMSINYRIVESKVIRYTIAVPLGSPSSTIEG